jgi:hypothetical protein
VIETGVLAGYAEAAAEALQAACLIGYVEYAGAAPASTNTADSVQVGMMMGYVESAREPLQVALMMGYAEIAGGGEAGPRYGPRWQ